MIEEVLHFQEIESLPIDLLVLDHFHFLVMDVKNLVLDIVAVIEKSYLLELHPIEDY